jgi:hypothetical protein
MASRYETGTYTNRGFASVDAHGFCEVLTNWLGRSYANRGAGWTLIDDQSAVNTGTFTVPDHTNDKCYRVGHGFINAQEVQVTTTGTLPAGLAISNAYKVIYIDADNFKLAHQLVDALAGTPIIDITSAGSGTHTVTAIPYKVYCNKAAPVINDTCNFLKLSYVVGSSTIKLMNCLWWDVVNHIPRGIWTHPSPPVTISGSDTYYFNGNVDFINVVTTGTAKYSFGTFAMNTVVNQSNTVVSTLAAGITAGSNVTVSLGSGEAANFILNKWYFLYDFDGHTWVEYVKVTAIDTGADTITLQVASYNFPTGSRIGVYPHRFYVFSQTAGLSGGSNDAGHDNITYPYGGNLTSTIPYYSSSTPSDLNSVFHKQYYMIHGKVKIAKNQFAVDYGSPNDEGFYFASTPIILEDYNPANTVETYKRILGATSEGSMYLTANRNVTNNVTKRSINGKLYMVFGDESSFFDSILATGNLIILFPVEDL